MENKSPAIYIFLIIIIIICLFGFYNRYKIHKRGVYSIATIYNLKAKRGRVYFDYDYMFRGQLRTSYASSYQINMNDEGKRFFILIDSENPSECLINTDISVPDSIILAPDDGWKELPINTPKE